VAAETRTTPPETRALAATAALLAPDTVADALLDGIARGRTTILPGRSTRLLAWVARVAPGLVRRVVDREIARAGPR
jgi:hypothetical protein